VVPGCVELGSAAGLATTSLTVDECSVSIGKRFLLHFSSVQHSATQRAKHLRLYGCLTGCLYFFSSFRTIGSYDKSVIELQLN